MKKIIQISDELFWGFNIIVDINDYKSFDELIIKIKNELISFLNKNNLLCLVDKAKTLNLHNHNYKDYNELYEIKENIIYICGHC